MIDDDDKLLTVHEVSTYMRVGPESIRRWLRDGKLAGVNLGRGPGWRIRRGDLAAFVASRRTTAKTRVKPSPLSILDGASPNGNPTEIEVTCVTKHPLQNPHAGVTHLGNSHRLWARGEVIEAIEAGTCTFYTINNDKRVEVAVYDGPQGQYIRGHLDGKWTDDLLSLTECATD
jgi:excisionase family DNA binding protein